ncbi:glycoprotein-N-acetylgalactosamine 3-beta-galactosyltransferase 1-A [Aplysia californica]|uniref:N-acetylgalactosaminide beta-1,3-galactosyltransferase n=1 Tax=Aplysia californica TaxID=6500 RepID=A0ABM0KAR3_APLCA|nr:glycoprotein-N-acetylgalactosamine 3-beta-galactosyltransferase 1-A [Aplysia californica]
MWWAMKPLRFLENRWYRSLSTVKTRDFLIGLVIGFFLVCVLTGRNVVSKIPAVHWNVQNPLTGQASMYQSNGALWINRDVYAQSRGGAAEGPPRKNSTRVLIKTEAEYLMEKVRILVWVMTTPKNLATKAAAVKETWGKRCNVLIFFSSVADPSFPTVGLDVADGRSHLTAKTMAAFRYLYDNHFNDADWFMKADDDTFVIPENLRHFLSDKNTSEPIHYGHLFRPNVEQGYYSGGGGYVVSKEALRRFGREAINSTVCPEDGKDEDVDWGLCMERLQVKTSPSVDKEGRTLFHPLAPTLHFLGKQGSWLQRFSAILATGYGVSPEAISFHYVSPEQMRVLTFYLYHWRPYGLLEEHDDVDAQQGNTS